MASLEFQKTCETSLGAGSARPVFSFGSQQLREEAAALIVTWTKEQALEEILH